MNLLPFSPLVVSCCVQVQLRRPNAQPVVEDLPMEFPMWLMPARALRRTRIAEPEKSIIHHNPYIIHKTGRSFYHYFIMFTHFDYGNCSEVVRCPDSSRNWGSWLVTIRRVCTKSSTLCFWKTCASLNIFWSWIWSGTWTFFCGYSIGIRTW